MESIPSRILIIILHNNLSYTVLHIAPSMVFGGPPKYFTSVSSDLRLWSLYRSASGPAVYPRKNLYESQSGLGFLRSSSDMVLVDLLSPYELRFHLFEGLNKRIGP